jgi:hypothetical protein
MGINVWYNPKFFYYLNGYQPTRIRDEGERLFTESVRRKTWLKNIPGDHRSGSESLLQPDERSEPDSSGVPGF